jgi:hypothetical protein
MKHAWFIEVNTRELLFYLMANLALILIYVASCVFVIVKLKENGSKAYGRYNRTFFSGARSVCSSTDMLHFVSDYVVSIFIHMCCRTSRYRTLCCRT